MRGEDFVGFFLGDIEDQAGYNSVRAHLGPEKREEKDQ